MRKISAFAETKILNDYERSGKFTAISKAKVVEFHLELNHFRFQ